MAQFVGLAVSLDCGDTLGVYQGVVAGVDNALQTISIENAFQNGIRCPHSMVTISARDIKDIHVVENIPKPKEDVSKLAVTNNVGVKQSPNVEQQQSRPISATSYESSPAKPKWMPNWQSDGESKNGKSTPPRRPANGRHQQHRLSRNEDAFSAQVEDGEFDFEKNLALFDKQAVFEEIDSRKTWNNARVANDRQAVAKYKYDENVLPSEPVTMNQIKVNGNGNSSGMVKNGSSTAVSQLSGGISEFVTDTGLVVPTVTYDVRSRLLALAAEKGLTVERQIEAAGRSAAEVVVQLLGGGHRLTPKNAHQMPVVVVLCNSRMESAIAVNCARYLALRNITVIVYVSDRDQSCQEFLAELKLFSLTEQRVTYNENDLPEGQVDLVLCAMDNHVDSSKPTANVRANIAAWLGRNRAIVMAIDPPATGPSVAAAKCSLSLALPLALGDRCGQVLLCDVALPRCVYRELGIQYSSPFAHKFVIPLHSRH